MKNDNSTKPSNACKPMLGDVICWWSGGVIISFFYFKNNLIFICLLRLLYVTLLYNIKR